MDSFKKFSEEKLSDKKCFYSSVKDGTTGDNDDHYLKKDVLLLADVFEKFIDTFLLIHNPRQNIWNKIGNSSKIVQDKKSLISTFACFLTAIAKV